MQIEEKIKLKSELKPLQYLLGDELGNLASL